MTGRLVNKILDYSYQYASCLVLGLRKVSFGNGCRFLGIPQIYRIDGSEVTLGNNVVLCSSSRHTALGVHHPVILRTMRKGAKIVIGDDTGISGGVICAAMSISIGNQCLIGANVTITDTDHHSVYPMGRRYNKDWNSIGMAPVILHDNVFIGTGTFIGKGVTIGENSIVAAGSVVVSDVQENTVVGGNPARVIGHV